MKQFSAVLNIVLLAAVAVLYYLHFSGNKTTSGNGRVAAASPMSKDSCALGHVIAYVDLDSINTNVDYIKQRKKELEAEQESIAREYEDAYRKLEADRNEFMKKGSAITQQQAEEFGAALQQRQKEVEGARQSKSNSLATRGAAAMEDMQGKLREFLNEYNKERKYSYIFATGTGLDYMMYRDSAQNITSEIVKGLNEKLNKKGKQ